MAFLIYDYLRVSQEEQNTELDVSLDQQQADIVELCMRNGWGKIREFVDCEDYKATQHPNKGKIVNPSGERADRPAFLKMLEHIKTGEPDGVVCWRDDRILRHPRVLVALEDALDIGDAKRALVGKPKIAIYDATGAILDRFTLSIKAAVWREENKRRAERTRMGKVGTLKEGRWPGGYDRLGYIAVKEEGQRGRKIVEGNPAEIETVQNIFNWYESFKSTEMVRKLLQREGRQQKGHPTRLYDWSPSMITRILRTEDYTGKAVWVFSDKTKMPIDIPAIISREQWERVQRLIDKNMRLATRNAKGVFLLQGLAECGAKIGDRECRGKISPRLQYYHYRTLADGTRKKYTKEQPIYEYRCHKGSKSTVRAEHEGQVNWSGSALDWAVWRKLVDDGIKKPENVEAQVRLRQQQLQNEGDSVDGEISHTRQRIDEIMAVRANYQRQQARGRITEAEFDLRMDETKADLEHWQEELVRLKELRDNKDRVQTGLLYARELMEAIQDDLPLIDQNPEELKKLTQDKQLKIMKARQEIVRALVEKVVIYPDGGVEIQGVLGEETTTIVSQDGSPSSGTSGRG